MASLVTLIADRPAGILHAAVAASAAGRDHTKLQYEPPQLSPLFDRRRSSSIGRPFETTSERLRKRARVERGEATTRRAERNTECIAERDVSGPRRSSQENRRARRHHAAAVPRRRLPRSRAGQPLDGPHALSAVRRVVDRPDRRPRRVWPRRAVARVLGRSHFDHRRHRGHAGVALDRRHLRRDGRLHRRLGRRRHDAARRHPVFDPVHLRRDLHHHDPQPGRNQGRARKPGASTGSRFSISSWARSIYRRPARRRRSSRPAAPAPSPARPRCGPGRC